MNNDPIEAFDWLLAAFRLYIRNQINWIDVRNILDEADAVRATFEQPDIAAVTASAEED